MIMSMCVCLYVGIYIISFITAAGMEICAQEELGKIDGYPKQDQWSENHTHSLTHLILIANYLHSIYDHTHRKTQI